MCVCLCIGLSVAKDASIMTTSNFNRLGLQSLLLFDSYNPNMKVSGCLSVFVLVCMCFVFNTEIIRGGSTSSPLPLPSSSLEASMGVLACFT